MRELLLVLGLAMDVAFSILAIRIALSWLRQPDRRHGHLALALGSLALLILISPVTGQAQLQTLSGRGPQLPGIAKLLEAP